MVPAALAVSAASAAALFAAFSAAGSSALLAEAIQALLGLCSQALLLVGLTRAAAQTPPSREPYFWTYVAPILLFALGAGVAVWEGIDKLVRPALIQAPAIEGWTLAAALAATLGLAFLTIRQLDRERANVPRLWALRGSPDPSRLTVLFQQAAAISGLTVALLALAARTYQEAPWADGAATIAIGLILALTAAVFAIEMKRVLARVLVGGSVKPEATSPSQASALTASATPAANPPKEPATASTSPQVSPTAQTHGSKGKRKRRR